MQAPLFINENGLTRSDVTHKLERQCIESDALRCKHPLRPTRRLALPEHQRSNTVRITEPQDPVTNDHCNYGIAAATSSIYRIQSRENVRGCDTRRSDALQL